MENWQAVMYDLMRGETNKFVICGFLVLWVFLGNFILLNLFIAILLDSFIIEEDEDLFKEPEDIRRIRKKANAEARKKRKDKKKVFMNN